jgi:ABC-2 type transport system ATP-binding protein
LVSVGHPDELRAQAGGPRVEIVGRGFGEDALALLRARSEVTAAEANNGRLVVDLCQEMEVAPLIRLLLGAGAEVEEVRRGKASLEDVFLTLMKEEQHV